MSTWDCSKSLRTNLDENYQGIGSQINLPRNIKLLLGDMELYQNDQGYLIIRNNSSLVTTNGLRIAEFSNDVAHLIPLSDNKWDLGHIDYRWKDICFGK